jgi:hypothetical protein
VFPSQFQLHFSNPTDVRDLAMDTSAAGALVKSRTSSYGDVNRRFPARIRFRLLRLKEHNNAFLAEIKAVTLYLDEERTRPLAEIRPPATEKPAAPKAEKPATGANTAA